MNICSLTLTHLITCVPWYVAGAIPVHNIGNPQSRSLKNKMPQNRLVKYHKHCGLHGNKTQSSQATRSNFNFEEYVRPMRTTECKHSRTGRLQPLAFLLFEVVKGLIVFLTRRRILFSSLTLFFFVRYAMFDVTRSYVSELAWSNTKYIRSNVLRRLFSRIVLFLLCLNIKQYKITINSIYYNINTACNMEARFDIRIRKNWTDLDQRFPILYC